MKNACIALQIFLCHHKGVLYNVCKFCNDLIISVWYLREKTDIIHDFDWMVKTLSKILGLM